MADSALHRTADAILLVDSDVLVRHGISDYLRDCGYRVIEAANSDEAQAVLANTHERVHAVLCAINIQGSINAFQLRHWINQNHAPLRTILAGDLTGRAEAAAEFCEEGPELARPYDPQGVIDYVRRLLASRHRPNEND